MSYIPPRTFVEECIVLHYVTLYLHYNYHEHMYDAFGGVEV